MPQENVMSYKLKQQNDKSCKGYFLNNLKMGFTLGIES